MRTIPKRWENYLPVGCRVPGTRFLPFKVPLKPELCRRQPENQRFTPGFLVESTPMLKAVIDLTNTDRYYDSEDFTSKGIFYKKINITGGGKLPSKYKRKEFFDAVDQLCEMLDQDSDALIGVHCTHGLNRTGYLICKYMVSRMKIDPQEAINKFEEARGHTIERGVYVQDLMGQEQQPQLHARSQPQSYSRPRSHSRSQPQPHARSLSHSRPQPQNWREECHPPRNWRQELPSPPRNWIRRSASSHRSRDDYYKYKRYDYDRVSYRRHL